MHADTTPDTAPDTATDDTADDTADGDDTGDAGDAGEVDAPAVSRGVLVFSLGMMAFSFVPWGIALALVATGALGNGRTERITVGVLLVVSQIAWAIGLFYGGAKYVKWWRARRRARRAEAAGETP